jgi:hypothetical protein
MTTSATAVWNRTRDQLFTTSLRLIRELNAEESPTPGQLNMGADFLQSLLLELHVLGVPLHVREQMTQSMSGLTTTTPYFVAPSDTDNLERLGAFVRGSAGIDIPLQMWDQSQYASIAIKTIEGTPGFFAPMVQSDHTIRVYIYPVPVVADWPTMYYYRARKFRDTDRGSYTPDVPVRFQAALEEGMAWKFATHYGRDIQAKNHRDNWLSHITLAMNNEAPRGALSFTLDSIFGS